MPWGAAAAAGGAIISGAMGASASKKASKAQAEATKDAMEAQQLQYDVARGDLTPWRSTGGSAITRLGDLMGITSQAPTGDPRYDEIVNRLRSEDDAAHTAQYGYSLFDPKSWYVSRGDKTEQLDKGWQDKATAEFVSKYGQDALNSATPKGEGYGDLTKKFTLADFWDDPVTKASYQQGLDQGTKALANMAGARGNRNSGAQLKALTRFATDYTGNQAAGSQGRFVGDQTNLYNRLAGVAGSGQTAATNTAQFGQNTANTIGGMLTAQGNARGAAGISGANAMGGALSNAANTYNSQNFLRSILGQGGGGGGGNYPLLQGAVPGQFNLDTYG